MPRVNSKLKTGSATILGQDCWKAATALKNRVAYVSEKPRYYDLDFSTQRRQGNAFAACLPSTGRLSLWA